MLKGKVAAVSSTFSRLQMLGTGLLVLIIMAVTDEDNMKIPSHFAPLFIGFGLCAIHLSFGLNAGCAVNPARDFSP